MSTESHDPLEIYNSKRDFGQTPEPKGKVGKRGGRRYLIQMHDARRLHYDFRLELDGVLKSWAVTKGPSLDPSDKRLAVRTEDHPLDYGSFEGVIPRGYGAGTVMLWDKGEWRPKGDPAEGLEKGVLKFILQGERLRGGFALVRMKHRKGEKRENWLLIKERDGDADDRLDPTREWRDSVETGRNLVEIAGHPGRGPDNKRTRQARKKKRESHRTKAAPDGCRAHFIPPQLATLRDAPPKGKDWIHEIKFDGYRIQALVAGGEARLITRNGMDWTARYPKLASALRKLDLDEAVIDGELVAVDESGLSRFEALQNIGRKGAEGTELRYYSFDLLHLDGEDVRDRTLRERKELLRPIAEGAASPVFYSDHIQGDGDTVIRKACSLGLEGVVSKDANAPYHSGRGLSWIKSKCIGNDEFVVVGYRKSDKQGRPFASLLLGEHEGRRLVYRGRVGTGFDESIFRELSAKMARLRRSTSPLWKTPSEARRDAVWLTPKLVAQIGYTEQTSEGRLRHPRYLGLREDKPAEEVTVVSHDDDSVIRIGGVRITHPDKVMFPQQGATKRATADYYYRNAERLLPFLANRPVSLVRCPSGSQDACFFQKHYNAAIPEQLSRIDITEKDGKSASYLVIRNAEGLVATAQIGALELHVWGARADRIERPERIVFDLDPDESVPFKDVRAAAVAFKDLLESIDMTSFPLLTGGKGIHVVVPIERRSSWDDVKGFARGLANKLAQTDPKHYVAQASKAKRKGRIFIDWLRNERGATAVAPYSLRARPWAPVATPVSWEELPNMDRASRYTLANIWARLDALRHDPWKGYHDVRQSLTAGRLKVVGAKASG